MVTIADLGALFVVSDGDLSMYQLQTLQLLANSSNVQPWKACTALCTQKGNEEILQQVTFFVGKLSNSSSFPSFFHSFSAFLLYFFFVCVLISFKMIKLK